MNTLVKKHKVLTTEKIKILLSEIVYYSLALILLFTGITKILDPLTLIETLKYVTIIPKELQNIIAAILPIAEICLGVLMILKLNSKLVLALVSVLFFCFLAFSVYGVIVGIDTDCGCFGNVIRSEFGWGMIVRNAFFFFCSLILLRNELNNN